MIVPNGLDQLQNLQQQLVDDNLNQAISRAYNLRLKGCALLALGVVFGLGALRSGAYACVSAVEILGDYDSERTSDISYLCSIGLISGIATGVFTTLGGVACVKCWISARNEIRNAEVE